MRLCKLSSFSRVALALARPSYFHLLFLQVVLCASFINGDASCNTTSMQCAAMDNISYPFWGSASCAASPSYVLSNCTSPSTQAYWDSFSPAASDVVGSPTVFNLTAVGSPAANRSAETSIWLSWNASLIDSGLCAPLIPSASLSLYNIPSSINLTRFPNSSALEFSSNNMILLFNCTHNTSDAIARFGSQNLQVESGPGCRRYKGLCPNVAESPCIQLFPSAKELMLEEVLDSLACSYFVLGFVWQETNGNVGWAAVSIELIWTDIECERCRDASGLCIYDTTMPQKLNFCMCGNGVPWDSNTQQRCSSSNGCTGGCNIGVKVGLGVAAIVVVLVGIWIAIKLGGMIRKGIKFGFLTFFRATIHISISILKKMLRKLQSVSVGPTISLNAIDLDGLTERPMEFSYSSIASATKSFSNLVGEGGFGKVYKGTIILADSSKGPGHSSEIPIAVKVLGVRSMQSKKQFMNEVVTIGRIHHVNVVRLLGFCMQKDHEMLLYEYVVNKSLDKWLFDKKGRGKEQVLDWGQRYTIALGIARGLSYLHEECRHRTIHCDIKPQNILLDENMHPKISDFGLAKLMSREDSKVVTFAKGTPGYMAPEFWMGGESQLSTKYDVYSYGMVLLELISGQRNFRHDNSVNHGSSFPARAFNAAMEGDLESILDSKLGITKDHGDEAQWCQIKTATFVALWCIQDQPGRRPHMSEVVKYLEGGAPISECPPQPNIGIFFGASSPPQQYSSPKSEDECTPLTQER